MAFIVVLKYPPFVTLIPPRLSVTLSFRVCHNDFDFPKWTWYLHMEFSKRERKTEKVYLVQHSVYREIKIRRNVATGDTGGITYLTGMESYFLSSLQCSRVGSEAVEPPGSGSVNQFGSGSSHHQAKIVRKPLIPTVLWLLYDFICEEWCKSTFKK